MTDEIQISEMFAYACGTLFLLWHLVLTLRYKRVFHLNLKYHDDIASAKQELQDTIRQHQGMIFKFRKVNGVYIHTLCDGELLYRLALRPEQVVGKELKDFLDEDLCKARQEYYDLAWSGRNVVYEGHENGINYLATLRPIERNGQIVEVIASCVDITDQKVAEEALRQSEEVHRLIAENTQDLIRIIDGDSRILYASPSHRSVLGYNPLELIGRCSLDLVASSDRSRAEKFDLDMLHHGNQRLLEYRLQHKNGNQMIFESTGVPVLDENGRFSYAVIISRDITGRREAEESMLRTEKLTLAGQLAAGVAHEIRNPLTSAKGFVQLIRERMDHHEDTRYFDIVLSELTQIENIINEFLMLSKPNASEEKEVSCIAVLRDVVALLAPQAIIRDVEIDLKTTVEAKLSCAESQIKQVFVNLIKNAIEAMPRGGRVQIEMRHEEDGDFMIQVKDEGIGMSEECLKKIGEPFYTTKETGTGLGFMVTSRIIRNYGGDIRLQSELGEGTTIQVLFPKSRVQVSALEPV